MTPHQNPPQAWELETAAVPARRFRLDNGLSAIQWGETGALILAMHGWQGRPTQFRYFAEALVPRGYRLVSVEGPGHGESPGDRASPVLFAEALQVAAMQLGPPVALIGHSMGGISAAIAIARGLRPAHLVLIGSPPAITTITTQFIETLALPPRARRALLELLDEHSGQPTAELDLLRLGPRLDVPALIVHDEDDATVPYTAAVDLAAHWPAAATFYTRGLGHRDLLADAAVVARVTAFIDTPAPAP
jgi:pimeloyl-ACP methyl ester carboxylesterase